MSFAAQLQNTGGNARPVILIVEDEALIRCVTAEFLRDLGFAVIEAGDATEALAILAADARIDAVFSDVQMPGSMDGLNLAAWIREHHSAPVLLTSGDGQTAQTICDPFLPKPYALPDVARRLRALLELVRR